MGDSTGIEVGEAVDDVSETLVRPDGTASDVALSDLLAEAPVLLDEDGVVRYRWVGEHPLDPTRDQPPMSEIHAAIAEEFDGDGPETFGF